MQVEDDVLNMFRDQLHDGSGVGEEGSRKSSPSWPDSLREEAFYGPAGELVRAIEPHSEADPVAILIQLLIGIGNLIGRSANFVTEADRQFTNINAVLVGQTAKARKGTSWGQVFRVLQALDRTWSESRIMSGLSTGEGLIWEVRDEQSGTDKRLLVFEPEFARVLQVMERQGNTLSAVLRQGWDTGNLRILTKKDPALATDAHISLIGHITKNELKRLLTDTATANGFANRFLWICARRSKLLPEGGALETVDFGPVLRKLCAAVVFARGVERMHWDEGSRVVWRSVYGELSEGKPGLFGAVTSRGEAQTIRLACIYALLDCSPVIKAEHLMAALEVWRYSEDSARFIFGDTLGDATADEIVRALRQRPEGMTRNEIREHFRRNKNSAEIERALNVLLEYGLARVEHNRENELQKKPTERWFAVRG